MCDGKQRRTKKRNNREPGRPQCKKCIIVLRFPSLLFIQYSNGHTKEGYLFVTLVYWMFYYKILEVFAIILCFKVGQCVQAL